MAYLELSCSTGAGNTGKQNCVEDFGQDQLIILCPQGTEIATKALAVTEATWVTLFNAAKATRCYPLFGHFNGEFDSEGRVIQEGWAGKKRTVRNGTRSATFTFDDIAFYLHKELRKHNGRTNLEYFAITANGYIRGWTDDGIVFKSMPIADFFVNDRSDNTGNEIDASSITIEYDGKYWNDTGVWVKPTAFDPLLFDGIKDVSITGTLTATTATVTVQGASDGIGVIGLIAANFNLYDDLAPTVAKTVVVNIDNADGTYVLTWASISGAHTLTLFGQPIGTNFYEAIDEINTTV